MLLLIKILFLLLAADIALAFYLSFSGKPRSKMLFAKFTPGAIISEIRNKIAATVYSKNGAGAIIRNRVTPINRRSTLQTNQRQLLGSLASAWRGLTQAERDGWNSATASFPQTDNLGQTVILTGEQLYVRCNANLVLIGQAQITAAPIPTSFAIMALGAVTLTAAAFTVAFTETPVPAGFSMVFRATRPVSAGKNFLGASEFRFVEVFAAAQATPADIDANYELIFGDKTGQVGQKVGVEAFLVEDTSGLASIPVSTTALIA
jgi:hypothetical protein